MNKGMGHSGEPSVPSRTQGYSLALSWTPPVPHTFLPSEQRGPPEREQAERSSLGCSPLPPPFYLWSSQKACAHTAEEHCAVVEFSILGHGLHLPISFSPILRGF